MTTEQRAKDLDAAKAAIQRHDHHTAAALFSQHADRGDAEAQYWLGAMYKSGPGVGRNFSEAMKWMLKAAEQGHAAAQTGLAGMYVDTRNEKWEIEKAIKWYRVAADQGYDEAQYYLGFYYALGNGVKQDWSEAYFWYSLATREKQIAMSWLLARETPTAVHHLTTEQKVAVEKRVKEWRQTHPLPWPSRDDATRPPRC